MTAPTTETAPAPARRGAGPQRKLGPLPLWGWAVLGVAAVAGVIIWRRSRSTAATAAATPTSTTTPETAIPVPENAGISEQQYAQLLDQDAQLFEAIQDLQGPKSKPKRDPDAEEDRESDRQEATENEPKPRRPKGACPPGYHRDRQGKCVRDKESPG